jgi:hypothetical protein
LQGFIIVFLPSSRLAHNALLLLLLSFHMNYL